MDCSFFKQSFTTRWCAYKVSTIVMAVMCSSDTSRSKLIDIVVYYEIVDWNALNEPVAKITTLLLEKM